LGHHLGRGGSGCCGGRDLLHLVVIFAALLIHAVVTEALQAFFVVVDPGQSAIFAGAVGRVEVEALPAAPAVLQEDFVIDAVAADDADGGLCQGHRGVLSTVCSASDTLRTNVAARRRAAAASTRLPVYAARRNSKSA